MKIKLSKSQWEYIGIIKKSKSQEKIYLIHNFIYSALQELNMICIDKFNQEYTDQERYEIEKIMKDLSKIYSRITKLYNPR